MRVIKSQSHGASEGGEISERRGDRSERWTSSRVAPDGQSSERVAPPPLRAGEGRVGRGHLRVLAQAPNR